MKVAIMQPYLFPYLGYFQLMKAVDAFVYYSDAQYIDQGWINRNRILGNAGADWLTIPVRNAPHCNAINDRNYVDDPVTRKKLIRKVEFAYRRAPYFDEVFQLVSDCFSISERNVAAFNQSTLMIVARHIGIDCEFLVSSDYRGEQQFKGQRRIEDICQRIGATSYLNPIGGIDLYDPDAFSRSGINLSFVRSRPTDYPQFGQPHVPYLSIIDVLMFNGPERVKELLNEYDSVAPVER